MNSQQPQLLIVNHLREQIRSTPDLQPHTSRSRPRRVPYGTTAAILACGCVVIALAVAFASLGPSESLAQTVIRRTLAALPDQGIIQGRARMLVATRSGARTTLIMEWWIEHAPDGTQRVHELDRKANGQLTQEFTLTIRHGRSSGGLYIPAANMLLALSQPYPARNVPTGAITGILTPGMLRQLLSHAGNTVKPSVYQGESAYTITTRLGARYIVDAHTYQIRELVSFRNGPTFQLTTPQELPDTPANRALLTMSPHPGAQHTP